MNHHYIDTSSFEHNKIYIVLVYIDGYWVPKNVKVWKYPEASFVDAEDNSKTYWTYNLYVNETGVDENGTHIFEIATFGSLEEAKRLSDAENLAME